MPDQADPHAALRIRVANSDLRLARKHGSLVIGVPNEFNEAMELEYDSAAKTYRFGPYHPYRSSRAVVEGKRATVLPALASVYDCSEA